MLIHEYVPYSGDRTMAVKVLLSASGVNQHHLDLFTLMVYGLESVTIVDSARKDVLVSPTIVLMMSTSNFTSTTSSSIPSSSYR